MTKSYWSEDQQKMMPTSFANTPHDTLPFPNGRKIVEISNADLANTLIAANVPGVSHSNGRSDNLDAYAKFLGEIAGAGAHVAMSEWIKSVQK